MTTVRKVIESIDLEKHGQKVHGNEDLSAVFGIHEYIEFDERIKMVFVRPHYCTYSWVGVRAYFLDGEFVAISTQIGRKWDEEFEFVSNEAAMKVKNYVLSFVEEPQYNISIADNLDAEIDDFYTVQYTDQILHKHGVYQGERVAIKRKNRKWDDFHTATIMLNGKECDVDCREIQLAYVDLS